MVLPSIEVEGEPIEEPPYVGEKLQGGQGTWVGERPTFEFHWLRCPVSGNGLEGCLPITRYEIRMREHGETKKERIEVTPEELKRLEQEKPGSTFVKGVATFSGHTVTPGYMGHVLRFEVVASNAEDEEGVSAVSVATEEVAATAEEAEEKERTTTFSCKKTPPLKQCQSPAEISYTIEKYTLPESRKQLEREIPLLAEPYEIHFTTQEENGRSKSREMIVLPDGPPAVTSQPQSVTVKEGEAASFRASASGGPQPTVQWEVFERLRRESGTRWKERPRAHSCCRR